VLPNKVAPITATAAIVKSILIRLFIKQSASDSYIIIPIIGQEEFSKEQKKNE